LPPKMCKLSNLLNSLRRQKFQQIGYLSKNDNKNNSLVLILADGRRSLKI
jgi:hypothetical protein